MTEQHTDAAALLARHAVGVQYDAIESPTIDATIDALFDTFACALGGLQSPGVPEARTALAAWGSGKATVWGGFGTAPAPFAAIANAGALHALDYDDTDDAVPLHANSVVLPALIADLEEQNPDVRGHEFLAALAVGIDGAMRIGRSGGPRGSRGWNYSVISGGIGAILALARLRQWDETLALSALGHELAQTAGSLQSIIDGSLAKRFQPAMVAKDTLIAVALAGAGVDGPVNVFEGRAGFFNLYQDGSFDRDLLLRDLGTVSLVDDLSLKPYPSCRFTHAGIDLSLQMREAGVVADDVAELVYSVGGQAMNMVGREFDHSTAGVVDAQFSLAYTGAVGLTSGGVVIGDFAPETIAASPVGEFVRDQVRVQATDEVGFLAMAPVMADVTYRDGRTERFVGTTVSGSPEARLTEAQLRAKADDCIQHGGGSVTSDELWDAVQQLKDDAPVVRVLELLRRGSEQNR